MPKKKNYTEKEKFEIVASYVEEGNYSAVARKYYLIWDHF